MVLAQHSRLLHRLRIVVAGACSLLSLLVLARLWCVDGLLRRITIDGPSMAPVLCGAHYSIQCGDCGFTFRCDAEHIPTDRRVACPNCGFGGNSLDAATPMWPDRVLIDRWPLLGQSLNRGSIVALRSPGNNGDVAVKRVAGLPGERLAIQAGDLIAGSHVIRKTAAELKAQRLLVHDNNYRPQTSLPRRWRALTADSRWKPIGGSLRFEPRAASGESIDWLQYEHWPCTADPRLRGIATAISDNDGFNQGETKRALNPVSDVVLSCRLKTSGTGQFSLAAVDGNLRFEIEIEPRKHVVLQLGGKTIRIQPIRVDFSKKPVAIEFGLCDQQVLLTLDGRTVLRHEYERHPSDSSPALHPLAIGAATTGLDVHDLRVWRDIYFLDPQGLPRTWSLAAKLGAGEFAFLGDNQPVSIDSRHWDPPAVPRNRIVGRVYRPFWTAQ